MNSSKYDPLQRFEALAAHCRFRPDELGREFAALLRPYRILSLARQAPAPGSEKLAGLSVELLWPEAKPADEAAAQCCLAGIYLYHDRWDRAHRIAQDIPTREGSYWHAIIHRREPDAWNSKYWFRRVGDHPVFETLRDVAVKLAPKFDLRQARSLAKNSMWDPFAFVDCCEQVRGSATDDERFCQELQMCEWMLLMKYCANLALGKAGGNGNE